MAAIAGNLSGSPNQDAANHKQEVVKQEPRDTSPVTVVIDNSPRSEPAQSTAPQPPQGDTPAEWVLVFVGIVTAGFICWQSWETRRSAQAVRDSIPLQQSAADAATKSADAAKISADIAAAVSIPTLVINEFDLGNPPGASLEAMLQFPTIRLVVINYGQTPAFLRSWTVVFTCEDLPDVPVYEGHPGSGMVLDKVTIQPSDSYTLPSGGFFGWQRHEFSLDDVEAIMSSRKILNVYGCICYWDIFGNPVRRLKFCETAIKLYPGNKPIIQWFSQAAPAAYRGTDLMPIGKATSGEGTGGQTARADTKTEDSHNKAN